MLVMMKGEERKDGDGETGYVLLGTRPAAPSTIVLLHMARVEGAESSLMRIDMHFKAVPW